MNINSTPTNIDNLFKYDGRPFIMSLPVSLKALNYINNNMIPDLFNDDIIRAVSTIHEDGITPLAHLKHRKEDTDLFFYDDTNTYKVVVLDKTTSPNDPDLVRCTVSLEKIN